MAETVERLAVLIEANTKAYERAMLRLEQKTAQAMNRSSAAVKNLDRSIATLSAGMVRFAAGVGVGAGLAFLSSLPKTIGDIVTEASGLAKAADRIGVTTDRLQELHHTASLADISIADFDKSMEQFTKRLGEALTGTGNLAKILAANNVPLRDAAGNMRSVNDLLYDYADLIMNAGSEQEKLYLATEAFGRSGLVMVNALNGGSAALRETAAEARALGGVIDEELLRSAEEINDKWTRFTTSLATSFKSFVLTVVTGVDDVIAAGNKLRAYLDPVGELGRMSGAAIAARPLSAAVTAAGPAKATVLPAPPHDPNSIFFGKASRAVLDLSDQIKTLEGSLTGAQEAMNFFAESSADAFMAIIPAIKTGNEALDQLLNTLIKAAAQALLLGQGPLAGLFGTAAAPGAIGGLFGGFRAGGGPVSPGKGYVVGERGPEIFMPRSAGAIMPNGGGSGGGSARVVVEAAPNPYFDIRVREVSGPVAVQTTRAGLAAYDQQKGRQQRLAG